ncbi:unnamed protein product, partial [Polarella glacialis]
LDILDMRRKLDEEERRLSEAKLMPIQLQVQELEARRLQEQGQVRQMELQYQLRQSELQQEEVRLHQAAAAAGSSSVGSSAAAAAAGTA